MVSVCSGAAYCFTFVSSTVKKALYDEGVSDLYMVKNSSINSESLMSHVERGPHKATESNRRETA